MDDLVERVLELGEVERKGRMPVYTAFAAEWRLFGAPRKPRPIDSVILAKGVMESILGDIKRFQGREQWYTERGIPYRRGYLMHGPPGCGKSSAIQAIAGHLGYGLAVLSLADRHISDDRLAHLMHNLPDRCILLLEDVDTVAPTRTPNNHNGLSLSGLLNAIDGAVASDARIIIMTTNNPHSLDAALIRPGRIDYAVEIGRIAEAEQGERMFERFYPACGDRGLVGRFGEGAVGRSPAQLQGLLINHPDDPDGAVRELLGADAV
jgi:chaperone BCS1